MLDNEKYVGDVMMQKRVTLDPLTHREVKNDQTVYPSHYVQDHHAAIIDRAQYNRVRKIRAMCNSKLGPLQYPYDDKLVCPICSQRQATEMKIRHIPSIHQRRKKRVAAYCRVSTDMKSHCPPIFRQSTQKGETESAAFFVISAGET